MHDHLIHVECTESDLSHELFYHTLARSMNRPSCNGGNPSELFPKLIIIKILVKNSNFKNRTKCPCYESLSLSTDTVINLPVLHQRVEHQIWYVTVTKRDEVAL